MKHQIIEGRHLTVGIDEVVGLKDEMRSVFKKITNELNGRIYWGTLVHESEYKRRDGFIPHSHNNGGLEISEVIPKCEEHEFDFLEFGDYDCKGNSCPKDECNCNNDGELDSHLRIWFKFEGIDQETQALKFYLYMGGGNNDAPYYRSKYEPTIFEAEFEAKSVKGLSRAASSHVKSLIKVLSGDETKEEMLSRTTKLGKVLYG